MSDANLSDSDIVNSGAQTFRSHKSDVNPEDLAQATQPTSFSRPKVNNQMRMQQSPLISTDRVRENNMPPQPFNNSKRSQTDDKGNRTLALMHKGLCKLPPMISEKLTSIKILDLSHNKFEYFPIEVTNVFTLQILRLNFNHIKKVPAEVSKLTGLEILSLSHNRLQNLPSTLPQLSALKGLHLESNFLESLGPEITNIQNLECLNIYHNRLHSLPTNFKNLKKLRELRFEWLRYLGSSSCYWRAEDDSNGITKLRASCEQLWNNGRHIINFAEFLRLFCRDNGQDIDFMYRDKHGCTLLHQACLFEDIGVMKNLLSIAPMLIDLADSQNRTPLCYSILKDKHKSSNFLLKHGANPTKQCGSEGSPIHIAVRKLNIDIVRGILRLGEKANRVDSDGNTPLHYAITMMHEDQEKATQIIEDLLDHGADPNIKNKEGWTPMHIAVRKRDFKTIEWALSYNFGTLEVCGRNEVFDLNVGGGPHNWTTMHIAAYSENPELVEMLAEAGADMFAKSMNGYTAKKVVGKPGVVLKLVTKYEKEFIKKKIIDQQSDQRFITPRERIPTQIVTNLHGGKKPVSNVSRNLFGNNYEYGVETCTNTAGNEYPSFSMTSNMRNFLTPSNHSRHPSHASTPFGAETRINMHITMTETKQLFIRKCTDESSEILPESEINTISHSIEDIDTSHPEFCGSEFNETGRLGSGSLAGITDRKILPTKNLKNKLTETLARITIRNDQGSSNGSLTFSQGNLKEISTALTTPSEIFDTQKYEAYLKSGLRSGFEFWDRQAKYLELTMLKEEVSFIERLRILSAFKIFQKVISDCAKKNPEILVIKSSIFSLPERSYSLQEKDIILKNKKEPSKTDKYLDLTLRSLVNVFNGLKNDVPTNVSLKMHICRFMGDAKLLNAITFLKIVSANTAEAVTVKMESTRVCKTLEMSQKPEKQGPSLIKGFRPETIKEKREGFQDRPMIFNVDKTSMAPFSSQTKRDWVHWCCKSRKIKLCQRDAEYEAVE